MLLITGSVLALLGMRIRIQDSQMNGDPGGSGSTTLPYSETSFFFSSEIERVLSHLNDAEQRVISELKIMGMEAAMRINTEASVMIQSLRVRAALFLGYGSYGTSAGGSLLRAEGFFFSLAILHEVLETYIWKCFFQKILQKNFQM
jgi:hypothetical protein